MSSLLVRPFGAELRDKGFFSMNSKMKGGAAGVAAAALLMGGTTFALWSDADTVNGGVVTAGNLDVAILDTAWFDVSADRVDRDTSTVYSGLLAHSIADISTWRMVPGDTIQYEAGLDVALEGDNLAAELSVDGIDNLVTTFDEVADQVDYNGDGLIDNTAVELVNVSYTVYDESNTPIAGLADIQWDAATDVYLQADSVGQASGLEGANVVVVSEDVLDGLGEMGVVVTVEFAASTPNQVLTQANLADLQLLEVSLDQVRIAGVDQFA